MSTQNQGGPAFPLALGWIETDQNNGDQKVVDVRDVSHGMSLRDYFAAKAMHALIEGALASDADFPHRENVSGRAYAYADAMLIARQSQPNLEPTP